VLASGEASQPMLDIPVGINSFSDISPDGKSIVFDSRGTWVVCEIPTCRVRKEIAPVRGGKPRWNRDGRSFTYLDGFNPSANLWIQPLDGSAPHQLTHFGDGKQIGHFAWSHDGSRLALSRAAQSSDIVMFRGSTARAPK
jgi:Tol biopolymer transport system component